MPVGGGGSVSGSTQKSEGLPSPQMCVTATAQQVLLINPTVILLHLSTQENSVQVLGESPASKTKAILPT